MQAAEKRVQNVIATLMFLFKEVPLYHATVAGTLTNLCFWYRRTEK
jgi:hypothetical protein